MQVEEACFEDSALVDNVVNVRVLLVHVDRSEQEQLRDRGEDCQ